MLASILLFLLPAALAAPTNVLLDLKDTKATVYYDLTNSLCGNNDPFVTLWAESSGINGGIPKCEQWAGANAKSLAGLATNRIVAIDASLLAADPDTWCGKEVVLFDAQGVEVTFSEGSLFVWDGCDAARTQNIVDLSAKAFTELKGGTCGGNNPTGLRMQVLDTNIWEPIKQGGSGGGAGTSSSVIFTATPTSTKTPVVTVTQPTATSLSTTTSTNYTTSTTSTTSVTSTSTTSAGKASASSARPPANDSAIFAQIADDDFLSSPSSSSSSSASPSTSSAIPSPTATSASSPDTVDVASGSVADTDVITAGSVTVTETESSTSTSCTYGAWQCSGPALQVCNYVETTKLAWETVDMCTTLCDVQIGGSVSCQ